MENAPENEAATSSSGEVNGSARPLSAPKGADSKYAVVLKAVVAVLLGSGSVFSVVQWAVKGPQYERQLQELKVEEARIELEDKKLKSEAEQKKNDIGTRADDLKLVEAKISLLKSVHEQEMESLKRELASLQNDRNANATTSKAIAVQLADRERKYRDLLEQFNDAISTRADDPRLRSALKDSNNFEKAMRSIAADASKKPVARVDVEPSADSVQIYNNNRSFCFPAGYDISIKAIGGSEDHLIEFIGTIDTKATVGQRLKRVPPEMEHVEGILPPDGIATFTTSGAPANGCYQFELWNIKIQKAPYTDIQDDGTIVTRGFAVRRDASNIPYVEAASLPEGFTFVISWIPTKH